MIEINTARFYEITQLLRVFRSKVEDRPEDNSKIISTSPRLDPVGANLVAGFIETVSHLRALLIEMGARVTCLVTTDLLNALHSNKYITLEEIAKYYGEIDTSLKRELKLCTILSLNSNEQAYYTPIQPLISDEFNLRFGKSGLFELDEAAKCLALGRSTATVFHLMRLMEVGIAAVSRCLSIPDPIRPTERNWGKILEKIAAGIAVKWPTAAAKKGDGDFFEEIYVSLDAVRNPWRNATMHVEKKYTTDEAEHIFFAVRGLMKKLASRCDENGDPKA